MKAVTIATLIVSAALMTTSTLAQTPAHTPAMAKCTCAANKTAGGWCSACKVGYVDGVKIKSRKLFDAVQGKPLATASMIKCPDCKAAFQNGGFCKECNAGFVDHKAYKSRVGYALARGQAKSPADIKCPKCKLAAAGHGWCKMCKKGWVGNVAYTDKEAYEAAVKARTTLVAATKVAEKCEGCAVAMVTDGKCEKCNVSFKDGKPSRKMGMMHHNAKP